MWETSSVEPLDRGEGSEQNHKAVIFHSLSTKAGGTSKVLPQSGSGGE